MEVGALGTIAVGPTRTAAGGTDTAGTTGAIAGTTEMVTLFPPGVGGCTAAAGAWTLAAGIGNRVARAGLDGALTAAAPDAAGGAAAGDEGATEILDPVSGRAGVTFAGTAGAGAAVITSGTCAGTTAGEFVLLDLGF